MCPPSDTWNPFRPEVEMIEKMKEFLRENSIGVLATCSENKPHCSLMTYVTDEQAKTIHIITLNTTGNTGILCRIHM